MMKAFRLFLSGKLFIWPSILNDSFTGRAIFPAFHDFEYFLPIPASLQSFFSEISWQSDGNSPTGN